VSSSFGRLASVRVERRRYLWPRPSGRRGASARETSWTRRQARTRRCRATGSTGSRKRSFSVVLQSKYGVPSTVGFTQDEARSSTRHRVVALQGKLASSSAFWTDVCRMVNAPPAVGGRRRARNWAGNIPDPRRRDLRSRTWPPPERQAETGRPRRKTDFGLLPESEVGGREGERGRSGTRLGRELQGTRRSRRDQSLKCRSGTR
jgi:hypothetical protein